MAPRETSEALRRLERELEVVGAKIVDHLQPGSPASDIEAELSAAISVEPHEDLLAWYEWHDGTDIPQPLGPYGVHRTSGQQLIGGWYLLGLADAVPCHQRIHADARRSGHPDWYPDRWFPILQYLTGGFLCLDTTRSGDGHLYIYDAHADLPDVPPTPQFDSIAGLADTFADLIGSGVASLTDYGDLIVDIDALPETYAALRRYW